MKTVKLIKQQGNSAIVMWKDKNYVSQCGIIDVGLVKGSEFEISDSKLKTATPYGIDWTVVYPNGLVISAEDLQEVLYGMNVITLDDLRRNTNGVIAAIGSILKLTNSKLLNHARITLGVGGK